MLAKDWLHQYSAPLLVLIVAVALSIASFFLPVPTGTPHEAETHWRMVSTVAMVSLLAGAALLFLRGLSAFKAKLRVAYRWFAVGMLLFALALLQWPFLVLLDAQESFWVLSGIVVIPFIVSGAMMYKGMRQFAKLLGVRTWLTSWPIALTLVTSGAILSAVASYVYLTTIGPPDVSDDTYLYTATVAWSTGFCVLAWLVGLKVRVVIGTSYQRPMGWLVIALGALSFSGVHEYITSYIVSPDDWYLYTGAISWPFVLTGLVFIGAGHMFSAERTSVTATRKRTASSDEPDSIDRAYIDSITTIAQLASRPSDIDPMLDGLRRVTAELRPGTSLSTNERGQLLDIYRQLESYLLTSDPLKTFTKEQLRPLLAPEFRSHVEE